MAAIFKTGSFHLKDLDTDGAIFKEGRLISHYQLRLIFFFNASSD